MEKENGVTKKIIYIISIILVVVFCTIFVIVGIDAIQHKHIGFDEAWNASVAANVARGHGYMESYQSPGRLFPTVITTGQTVLLPTAILYKIFGVNLITSSIIPLLFGMTSIIVTYIFIFMILKAYAKRYEIDDIAIPFISVILTIFDVLSRRQYNTLSTGLLGETAALFFILISGICIFEFYKTEKPIYILIASGLQIVALMTKPEVIMINVSIIGCVIITSVALKSYRTVLWTALGCIIGLVATDLYKFIKMGASIRNYLGWWDDEVRYMFQQSSGVDVSVDIQGGINSINIPKIIGIGWKALSDFHNLKKICDTRRKNYKCKLIHFYLCWYFFQLLFFYIMHLEKTKCDIKKGYWLYAHYFFIHIQDARVQRF